jgi:hypothetical protein
MRWLLIVLAFIAAVVGIGYVEFTKPDIPRATLEAKYATPPSQFVTLPDGARVPIAFAAPRILPRWYCYMVPTPRSSRGSHGRRICPTSSAWCRSIFPDTA